MRYIYGFIILLEVLVIFHISYKKNRDLFSPMCIFSFLQGLRYLPGIFLFESNMQVELNDNSLLFTFVIETIAIACTVVGYKSRIRIRLRRDDAEDSPSTELHTEYAMSYFSVAVLCIAIGFIFLFLYMRKIGGIATIVLDTKAHYAGTTYYTMLSFLCITGCVILISCKKRKYIPIILITYIIYIIPFLLQLRRSAVLEPVLYLLAAYHYSNKRIRIEDIIKPRVIVIIVFILLFIITVPAIRNTRSIYNTNEVLQNSINGFSDSVEKLFNEFCYVGRDTFVYNNYNSSNYYYGRTVINLLCSPIPASIFANKPPVDDGRYLYNFMRNYYILPPSGEMVLDNSVPFSTQGSLFANFGIIGVIIGCYICGRLYRKVYENINSNPEDALNIIIYLAVMYQLEFSSLSIVQTMIPVVITFFILKIIMRRHERTIAINE